MNKDIKLYYLTSGIFEFSRTIPHAFVTMYLLSTGLTISQITTAQIFFMVAAILFEIPGGILADKYNKKIIFVSGCFCISISYILYIHINGFASIALAQFLYGLGMSIKNGTIDSLTINKIFINDKDLIANFTRWNSIIGSVAMLAGATTGVLLYNNYFKNYVYIISVVLFIISAVLSFTLADDPQSTLMNDSKYNRITASVLIMQLKNSLLYILHNKIILSLVIMLGSLQFILQPLYNYWQPISTKLGFSMQNLSIIYISIQCIGIFSAYVYKKFIKKNYSNNIVLKFTLFQIIIALAGLKITNKLFLAFLLLSIIPNTFMNIKLNTNLQKSMNNTSRSTITSINSAATRVFSIINLGFISILSKYEGNLGIVFSISSVICCAITFIIYQQFYKKGENSL